MKGGGIAGAGRGNGRGEFVDMGAHKMIDKA